MENLDPKYNPKAVEARLFESWEAAGYFTADPQRGQPSFTIVIPPPNVTGVLHIGHALNGTIQDILTRWHRMRGDNTLWIPGTDHAGIATQHVVSRKLAEQGVDSRKLTREEFLKKIWEWKDHHGSTIIRQFKTLGCSCDWTRERFTMDEGLSRAVRIVFKRLFDEGLIYRGDYMVNWSPKLQTALSDDEVEHREVDGHLWYFKYPLADGSGFATVATTRPETMLGDTAVAVNPADERYKGWVGKIVRLPLMNRDIPVIADDYVSKEFGTGMVKITPAHDPNDYEMGKRHDLRFINLLNPDGTLNENAGPYAGLTTAEARKRVVEAMEAQGLLEKVEPNRHTVGHCYRSGCVIEPYISKQWFVRMRPLAEPALEAVRSGRARFVPGDWDKTYFQWMENVRDWCISRQLVWGHRIPVYTCSGCGQVACEIEPPAACPKCGGAMTQDPDVLDTWFSSALWPFSTMGWPEETPDLRTYYPTSVLVTAHDIIFFWVARMIMMGLKFMGEVPFRTIFITPLIMAESGGKMSKSKGNAIDPLDLVEQQGADAVRLTLASHGAQSRTVKLSMKRFEGYRNFTNKLWNAARFVLMNVEDLSPDNLAAGTGECYLELEDRWILSLLRRATEDAERALEGYQFEQYLTALYDFTWKHYCDWYLELVKPRLYASQKPDYDERAQASRRSAQVVLVTVLETLQRLFHPVAPFITEAIWQRLKQQWGVAAEGAASPSCRAFAAPSLVVAPWPLTAETGDPDESAERRIELLQEVVYLIRNIRGEMGVPPGATTDVEIVSANAARLEELRDQAGYMEGLLNLGRLRLTETASPMGFASTAVFEDVVIRVPLPPELRDQEAARLDKEIARIQGDIQRIRGKLANEQFSAHAPAEIVEGERQRLAQQDSKLKELETKRASLA